MQIWKNAPMIGVVNHVEIPTLVFDKNATDVILLVEEASVSVQCPEVQWEVDVEEEGDHRHIKIIFEDHILTITPIKIPL